MKWPWSVSSSLRLSLRSSGPTSFAYVLTDPCELGSGPALPRRVLKWGAVSLTPEAAQDGGLARAIQSLGLQAGEVIAVLDQGDYQILKIDTPNVPNEELKAAARWQIKELVDAKLEELILDVMHVGGDAPRAQRQLFVVAARSSALTALSARSAAAGLALDVVDTWETALRNLQSLQAEAEGLKERACAALLMMDDGCLLTVSAGGELYYTRRLDVDASLVARASGNASPRRAMQAPLGAEYQPGGELIGDDDDEEESLLIIELQRSIDLWERSWPELPLARLYVAAPRHGEAFATLIQQQLGLRTLALSLPALFSGLGELGGREDELAACLPLFGASLRLEQRAL